MEKASLNSDYWNEKLRICYTTYLHGGMDYEQYLNAIAQIHDLLVDEYYLGAEELEQLIYDIEAKLEHGVH